MTKPKYKIIKTEEIKRKGNSVTVVKTAETEFGVLYSHAFFVDYDEYKRHPHFVEKLFTKAIEQTIEDKRNGIVREQKEEWTHLPD